MTEAPHPHDAPCEPWMEQDALDSYHEAIRAIAERVKAGADVPKFLLSEKEIDAAKTPNGGWTRETLARWGLSWPPPKGWRQRLMKP